MEDSFVLIEGCEKKLARNAYDEIRYVLVSIKSIRPFPTINDELFENSSGCKGAPKSVALKLWNYFCYVISNL